MANPMPIVGPQYCAPHPVDLVITKKHPTIADGNFGVTDMNGNILFKVKVPMLSMHDTHLLLDAAGNPIVSLRQKIMSVPRRWKVYRGDSSSDADLLFSAKLSPLFQIKTKLAVFLASNTREEVCDFKVEESGFKRSCVVYAGESTNIVAQMHTKHSVGKDKFMVTVHPHLDQAFVVALIVILSEIGD